jgi:hypothetical protein
LHAPSRAASSTASSSLELSPYAQRGSACATKHTKQHTTIAVMLTALNQPWHSASRTFVIHTYEKSF